jgi:hypothetical protein
MMANNDNKRACPLLSHKCVENTGYAFERRGRDRYRLVSPRVNSGLATEDLEDMHRVQLPSIGRVELHDR